ncbi:MAG: hypothetical protein WBG73_20820 [Coleofasciculaceae cyanobacterium]
MFTAIKNKFPYLLITLLISIVILSRQLTLSATNGGGSELLRDKHQWPFSPESIWNMPIGSQAQYVPANIDKAQWITPEVNYYIVTSNNDPLVSWYVTQNWGVGRCELGGTHLEQINVPRDLIVPDATSTNTPNNAAAFLHPDGRKLIQMNPLARCEAGGSVFGYPTPGEVDSYEDIYGEGITGGQGGSGLSSIGGTIRLGELLPSAPPIRHTLKLLVYAHKYLYKNPPGYRWPAVRADDYAFKDTSELRYGGSNLALVMGSLLAIPPSVTETSLGLKTSPGKKLFHALQDYGGYIVDDTAWDNHAIAIEKGVADEFKSIYGYSFDGNSGTFHDDINKLFQALYVVNNNGLNSVGGGGTPRQPLAPPIGN